MDGPARGPLCRGETRLVEVSHDDHDRARCPGGCGGPGVARALDTVERARRPAKLCPVMITLLDGARERQRGVEHASWTCVPVNESGPGTTTASTGQCDREPHAEPLLSTICLESLHLNEPQLHRQAHRAVVRGLGAQHHLLPGKRGGEPRLFVNRRRSGAGRPAPSCAACTVCAPKTSSMQVKRRTGTRGGLHRDDLVDVRGGVRSGQVHGPRPDL